MREFLGTKKKWKQKFPRALHQVRPQKRANSADWHLLGEGGGHRGIIKAYRAWLSDTIKESDEWLTVKAVGHWLRWDSGLHCAPSLNRHLPRPESRFSKLHQNPSNCACDLSWFIFLFPRTSRRTYISFFFLYFYNKIFLIISDFEKLSYLRATGAVKVDR